MTLKISLKAARINAGLTQEAVAAMLKKSKVTIINWEKGKTSIDKGNFDALCRLYSVDEDNIFLPSIATKSKQEGATMLSIKVPTAAKIMGKSEQFVRIGLQRKLLPFGTAVKVSESRYSYHISAAQFCDYMGLTPEELIALKY